MSSGRHTTSLVPTGYDQLFRHYYPYVSAMVRKFNVPESSRDDVAMMLVTKFIEKDMLGTFDPERLDATGNPVKFSSYLSGFVVAYIRYYVEREYKEASRSPNLIDETTVTPSGELTWLDLNGFTHEDDLSHVDYELMVDAMKEKLKTVPTKNKRDFHLLFSLMVDQLREKGRLNRRELAEMFEVSDSLISLWQKMMITHLQDLRP